jgi:hypothetical protein
MPVKQYQQYQTSEHASLAAALAAEWINPQPAISEPVILEETVRGQGVAHVYVVWSKWADLDGVERSEIIMEAAEKKFSPDEVLNISIAMGLTPIEADRLHIEWRT